MAPPSGPQHPLPNAEFAGAAANQSTVLQNGINEYLNRLTTLKMLFESADVEVTRHEFQLFVAKAFRATGLEMPAGPSGRADEPLGCATVNLGAHTIYVVCS